MTLKINITPILIAVLLVGCDRHKTIFESLAPARTGVDFVNKVEEDEKYNVLTYMNIYTGAGVAAGDFNNDGLVDLFFSGNQSGCRLYINTGDLTFKDMTAAASISMKRWCTGVSLVDINQDGFLDIYINVAGSAAFGSTANALYVNDGKLGFTEQAQAYGIADTRLTMNASFFDYDRDGDLDLFLITNPADEPVGNVNTVLGVRDHGQNPGSDILYRNDGNDHFTDVSAAAGIQNEGFSLGTAIADINNDGWPDIYVSNDFLNDDLLYLNNKKGGFTESLHKYFRHTSFSSMGNDVADINNDGLPDVFTLDMLPEDNYRKKLIIPAANYDKFQLLLQKGYEPQYSRNVLQLNNGDSTFSDIGFIAGVSATDWSWAALFADYDNDGDKDLLVTNGFYRDFGDQDFIQFQNQLHSSGEGPVKDRQRQLDAVKTLARVPLQDYVFENTDNLRFTNRSTSWGLTEKGFSNGACYADLDNDGDLELVINQFNGPARIYKNNARELAGNNFLTLGLVGTGSNRQGIGSRVYVYTERKMQMQEMNPYRGYESTVDSRLHFGLGRSSMADSVVIIWPQGERQVLRGVMANSNLVLAQAGASENAPGMNGAFTARMSRQPAQFSDISDSIGLNFLHRENYFSDFRIQPLMPHMLSRCGPGIAVGDFNADGTEDFYIGGAAGKNGSFFLQNNNGGFMERSLTKDTTYEDMGVLAFDADNDNDLDLYVTSGSSEKETGSLTLQDRLYRNDGKGNFSKDKNAIPDTRAAGSCVVGCDYDKDGDIDLFVGGRVVPGNYPLAPQSYLLKNSGGNFSDNSIAELPDHGNMGMVTTALWTDYDGDGWVDLLVAGEFMPVTFIRNQHGTLIAGAPVQLAHSSGWWNSVVAGDFDGDGDIDYVLGNLGLNTRHKASPAEPLCIYARDFDKNGSIDPVMCYYVQGKNFVYPARDELVGQIPAMRKRFEAYKAYASADFDKIFTGEEKEGAVIVRAECFETSYFENMGNDVFERRALPLRCQLAPVFGMVTGDYNDDGYEDILLCGNSYSTEVSTGNYDGLYGTLLLGDGKGNFNVSTAAVTGFVAGRDGKGMATIHLENGNQVDLVANNNDRMQAYLVRERKASVVKVLPADAYAILEFRNGRKVKHEFYYGSGYLGNSSRQLRISSGVIRATIFDSRGTHRELAFVSN